MTEDDTFLVLSRPGLWEMKNIYQEWMRENPNFTIGERRVLFNSHRWSIQEFIEEHSKRNIKLPHD